MRRFDFSLATSLVLLLGLAGCSLVIDSSKYVGEGVDGGMNDGAPSDAPLRDGELPDGGMPVELAPAGSVALGDYTPMAGDRVPVVLGPNTLGVTPTLEWKRGASSEWEPLAGMELMVPVDATGEQLFVRATWTPSLGEPLVREAGPAEVIERSPAWRPVLPDVGRETTAFWDPINQRWIFVSERSGASWWELAIPDGGPPRLVPLGTPLALPRLNEGYGFVAVPDLPRQRMLFIGANLGAAQVFAMSLARSGPVTVTPLPAAGTSPDWRRVPGVTWVPAASGTGGSVLVCGGLLDGERPEVTDECSALEIAEGGGVTWGPAQNLPRALGGMALFAVDRTVYGFGGLSFDTGATNGLMRLDAAGWSDVALEGAMPSDARAAVGAAVLGSRVYLVGGVTLTGEMLPSRAPGRIVLDFASDPPTIARDAAEIPGGVGAAVGFVGTTMHAFDGFDPSDSDSDFDPASFRRLRADGPVEGYFVFGVTTPPPLVSGLAGWTREGSLVYGGRSSEAGPALSGAWTFEGGVQRAVMLDGAGPGARAEVVIDTRAMIGRDPDSTGFPWTVFGGGTNASERSFFVYDGSWESQSFVSGGPSPVARGAMVVRTQGCGPSTFLLGGRTTTEVLGSFEAWGCTDMSCSWSPGLPSPGLVTNGTLTWDGDRTLVLLGGLANDPVPPGYARVIDHCVDGGVAWRDIELSAAERQQMQRYGHTTTSLGFGGDAVFVMVGGVGLTGELIDEVVGLRISGMAMPTVTGEIMPLPTGPSARVYHTALRSRDGDRLWIVGGRNRDGNVLSDVWELRRP